MLILLEYDKLLLLIVLDILPIQSYPCPKLEIDKGEKQT